MPAEMGFCSAAGNMMVSEQWQVTRASNDVPCVMLAWAQLLIAHCAATACVSTDGRTCTSSNSISDMLSSTCNRYVPVTYVSVGWRLSE